MLVPGRRLAQAGRGQSDLRGKLRRLGVVRERGGWEGEGRGGGGEGADLSAAINQTVDSISPPFAAPPARSGVDSSWQRLLFTTPPFVLAVNPLSVPVSQSHKLPVNQLSVPVSQSHKLPVNQLSILVMSQSHQPPVNRLSVPVS